ncbi:hypothetical protein HAU43_00770 [Weissella confusa]|uniref:Uncharacterized protein n=1 Tax=Weissella confusa TaxID=1583 RepID=A0AAE2S5A9_WEICO|nr:hypothetical protein [Weissella confusa]MBJ7631648.1 hypothetical protein [Weissella confusa]MBJ7644421.1 hypothetical protein [Weissella confusa]TGE53977.1 hypothetical protein C6P22_03685 [Weissella confusa]
MVKKIVEVPDNTTEVAFFDGTSALGFGLKVNELKNAPEKRVIELPVELFNYLLKIKKTHRGGISHFMSGAIKKRLIIQDLDTEDVLKDEMLVDWYLHPELVEFVPKKEQRFHVMTDFGTLDARDEHGETLISFETLSFLKHHGHYYEFSEADADKLVAGLSALKARKVKVDE